MDRRTNALPTDRPKNLKTSVHVQMTQKVSQIHIVGRGCVHRKSQPIWSQNRLTSAYPYRLIQIDFVAIDVCRGQINAFVNEAGFIPDCGFRGQRRSHDESGRSRVHGKAEINRRSGRGCRNGIGVGICDATGLVVHVKCNAKFTSHDCV